MRVDCRIVSMTDSQSTGQVSTDDRMTARVHEIPFQENDLTSFGNLSTMSLFSFPPPSMHTSLDCRLIGCIEAPETINEAQRAFVPIAEQVLLRLGFF